MSCDKETMKKLEASLKVEKTLLRVMPWPDSWGYYEIRAYLTAKTRAGLSSEPLPNDDENRRSWQRIFKHHKREVRDQEVDRLLATDEYELEKKGL